MRVAMLSEVTPLRHASRELVRELGFLQGKNAATNLWHTQCHALIEIDARGQLAQAELPALLRLDKSTASRIVADLEARGWVRVRANERDARARVLALTPRGREKVRLVHGHANGRVEEALRLLPDGDRALVVRGMQLYARALEKARRLRPLAIRALRARDNTAVARLIRTVMPEFGASGPGFAILDPEVDDMAGAYRAPRSAYFVVVRRTDAKRRAEEVVGGGGYAPLKGGDEGTCELRKMYFLRDVRGLGLGQTLLDRCLAGARSAGFRRMYLETLTHMTQARALYERNGFVRLERSLGDTGHHGCNAFYALDLA